MSSDGLIADFAHDDRDINRILILNESEYGPASPNPSTDVVSTRASFTWRRDQNPAGQAIIPVIRNHFGDVVGFFWLIPMRIRAQEKNYVAATGANLVIAPEGRRTFGYTKLMRNFTDALKDTGAVLHFSFVSEENYKRLRAENSNRTFTVPLLLKPLEYGTLVKCHLKTEWQRFLANKARWILEPLFFRRPSLPGDTDVSVQMLDQFDESFDDFWNRVQDKYRAIAIRDQAFLKWRFTPVSARRYHILVARSPDKMLGYSVIRCANVRGIPTGLILDLLLLDSNQGEEAGVCLTAHAEAFFRSQKMSLIAALMVPGSAEYRVLRLLGCRNLGSVFSPRPFRFAFFVHREDLKSLSVKDWFVTLADFESL